MTHFQRVIANNEIGLSSEEIGRVVPAAYAITAHDSRSARYTTIPNGQIVDALADEGFVVTQAMQANTHIAGGENHARHQLTFSHRRDLGLSLAAAFRIVLTDDSMGGGCFLLRPGYFRMICGNGMFSGNFEIIKVRHTGNIVDGVVNGVLALVQIRQQLLEYVEQERHILLPERARTMFAEAVAQVRWGEAASSYNPQTLLLPAPVDYKVFRSGEEQPTSIYNTANTIQYQALHGGQRGYDQENRRRTRARGVTAIQTSNAINEAIAGFAKKLREQFGQPAAIN